MDHTAVLQQVLTWARGEENVRAVVLTGSVARGDTAFDALSDLDIELYVNDPAALLSEASWYEQFGEVLVVEALANPGWHPTRLVYYAHGKIDFMIAAAQVLTAGVWYERPFDLLLDKDHARGAFHPRALQHDGPPAETQYLECVHGFYAAAIMWAKYLVRDDPWSAKVRDWDSKTLLLQMVEWEAKIRRGFDLDTWKHGAHLRDWVDPEVVGEIERCWCGCSRVESEKGLFHSLVLFDHLSTRVAAALGFQCFDVGRVRDRIKRVLGPAGQTL